jgi:NitT/TauT family transport system ATP-binding protein
MRKRVDLARAYAANPAIMLMDEPLGSLDVQTKEELQTEIQRIWLRDQIPTVFITHDLEEAIYLTTRILVLSRIPARIIADIPISQPMPRDPIWKLSSEFVSLRREIRELLTED